VSGGGTGDERSCTMVLHEGAVLLPGRLTTGEHVAVVPGGGVENGETPEEAARRELTEETSPIANGARRAPRPAGRCAPRS
jgi:ADP-ribose pyrophosphatase YjhB (NUDIX family)